MAKTLQRRSPLTQGVTMADLQALGVDANGNITLGNLTFNVNTTDGVAKLQLFLKDNEVDGGHYGYNNEGQLVQGNWNTSGMWGGIGQGFGTRKSSQWRNGGVDGLFGQSTLLALKGYKSVVPQLEQLAAQTTARQNSGIPQTLSQEEWLKQNPLTAEQYGLQAYGDDKTLFGGYRVTNALYNALRNFMADRNLNKGARGNIGENDYARFNQMTNNAFKNVTRDQLNAVVHDANFGKGQLADYDQYNNQRYTTYKQEQSKKVQDFYANPLKYPATAAVQAQAALPAPAAAPVVSTPTASAPVAKPATTVATPQPKTQSTPAAAAATPVTTSKNDKKEKNNGNNENSGNSNGSSKKLNNSTEYLNTLQSATDFTKKSAGKWRNTYSTRTFNGYPVIVMKGDTDDVDDDVSYAYDTKTGNVRRLEENIFGSAKDWAEGSVWEHNSVAHKNAKRKYGKKMFGGTIDFMQKGGKSGLSQQLGIIGLIALTAQQNKKDPMQAVAQVMQDKSGKTIQAAAQLFASLDNQTKQQCVKVGQQVAKALQQQQAQKAAQGAKLRYLEYLKCGGKPKVKKNSKGGFCPEHAKKSKNDKLAACGEKLTKK